MNSKQLHSLLLTTIGILIITLIGGAYITNLKLTKRADSLLALKARNMALSEQQLSLTKAKKDIKQYAGLKKITQSIVPEDKNQAAAVREIVAIAAANKISLAGFNFPASTLGNTTIATPGVAAPKANAQTGKLSQLTPVKNIPGVYNLLITVQGDTTKPVTYNKFVSFLDALEHNRRTAQVSAITIAPNADNRNLISFTLSLNEYIKP